MVSFFHTSLLLCVFVATRAFPQPTFVPPKCPDKQCSTSHLEDFNGYPCLKLNEEIVYRCQKFKCVMNMTVSDSIYTLQPGEEIGCYLSHPDGCLPFKPQMNQIANPDRMGCFCDKHNSSFLIICQLIYCGKEVGLSWLYTTIGRVGSMKNISSDSRTCMGDTDSSSDPRSPGTIVVLCETENCIAVLRA